MPVTVTSPSTPRRRVRSRHGQPDRGARLPDLPPGAAHPGAGRSAALRHQPPGRRAAPRGGRHARRRQHRLLHPPRARQPHRRLRVGPRGRWRARCSSTSPNAPTCSTSPAQPTPAAASAARPGKQHLRPGVQRILDSHRRPGLRPQQPPRPPRRQPARTRPALRPVQPRRRAAPTWRATCSSTPAPGTSTSTGHAVAKDVVAALRIEAGRNPYDRGLTDLVGELSTRSEEFRTWWAATTSGSTAPPPSRCTTRSSATSSSPARRWSCPATPG